MRSIPRREDEVCPTKLLFIIEIAFGLTPFAGSLSRALNMDELERPGCSGARDA